MRVTAQLVRVDEISLWELKSASRPAQLVLSAQFACVSSVRCVRRTVLHVECERERANVQHVA